MRRGNSICQYLLKDLALAASGYIEGLLRWARVTANVLAFFVALIMALDLHPAHAHASGDGSGHSAFGATCDTPDVDNAPLDGNEATSGTYADCVHHCPVLLRATIARHSILDSGALENSYAELPRRMFSAFDPPPPRALS